MLHHLRDVLVTLVRITLQHPHQQVLGLVANEGLVENEVVLEDFFKHPLVIVIVERRQAGEHLVEKDTETVDVESAVMAIVVQEHLRAQVLWRATERV